MRKDLAVGNDSLTRDSISKLDILIALDGEDKLVIFPRKNLRERTKKFMHFSEKSVQAIKSILLSSYQ